MVAVYALFLIFASAIPAIAWILFFLKEDTHPEPKKLIMYTFALGGLISIPTLATQVIFQKLTLAISPNNIPVLIIGLALIEEVFKFVAANWSVGKSSAIDEPVDAMIYMVAAALGFATIENLFIVSNQLDISSAGILNGLSALSLRFVGATLLHTLSSALLGFYWAKGRFGGNLRNSLAAGLLVATAVHALFNYLVLNFQDKNLLYPSLFLLVAAFFVLNDFEKLKEAENKYTMT